MSDTMKELEELLERVRAAADGMAYEEGSGRSDYAPTQDFIDVLAEIRKLFQRTLSSEG
jgi:hypothetical protein